jgi:hypothetical protein
MMSRDLRVIVSAPGPTSAVAFANAPQRHAIFTTLEELTTEGHDAVRVVGLPSGQEVEYIIHANDRIYEITPPSGSTVDGAGPIWLARPDRTQLRGHRSSAHARLSQSFLRELSRSQRQR